MKFSELLSNKFVRITLMIFFFLFVYKILFAIGIFFAIDRVILSMYLCWIGVVILLASFLQFKKTNFNVNPPLLPSFQSVSNEMSEVVKKASDIAEVVVTTKVLPTTGGSVMEQLASV